MEKPAVLVIGAGALGMVTGYHLSLGGSDVTFLVRPARVDALQVPQVLYCYDDGQLKQYQGYRAVGSVPEAAQQTYDFVLVTLDGAVCRGEEGTELLRELGDAIRNTSAVAIVCGIGVREHCRQAMQLPDDRVLEGTMRMLSYQVDRVTLPLHPPTDPDQLAQASFAYQHIGGSDGFMVVNSASKPAQDFAELYNRCGVSRCQTVDGKIYTLFARAIFPIMAVFDLAGWPNAAGLAENRELMSLCSRAVKEIMRLPEHGWPGKLGGLLMNRKILAMMNAKMERDCLPVDYSAFNRFHHGGKVREQDRQVMQQSAESGRAQGMPMPALNELIRRYDAHCASR